MQSVEKDVRSILLNDKDLKKVVSNIFIGVAPTNIAESLKAYILITTENQRPVDRSLSGSGFRTSMNTVTISCYGREYDIAYKVSEMVLAIIEEKYNSSVIGIGYDTEFVGNNVWHIQDITSLLMEKHDV